MSVIGTKLYSYVDADDNTSLDGLSFFEKVLALIFQYFKTSGREQYNKDRLEGMVSEDLLVLQADLVSFMNKALEPIKQGRRKSVVIEIDSVFAPVLKNVLENSRYKDYYNIEIAKWPKVDYNIKYTIVVIMKAR